MGNRFTYLTNRETRLPGDSTNLKLEAQKIKDFSGNHEEWARWKSRTECAFNGSGYEKILSDKEYSTTHERMNLVVYSQLAASTVDGVAYHLVQKYEPSKDGHAAWQSLCEWYDGDTIQNETAENLRVKLDNLKLHSGITASEYVNKFLAWHRDLSKIEGEGLSTRHAVYLFLKNISDADFLTSITFCRNPNATLDECIAAVRKQERDLQQKRIERKNLKSILRRAKTRDVDSDEDDESTEPPTKKRKHKARRVGSNFSASDNSKFEGELETTERGLLRFSGECWKKMDESEKEFVREYNASVKHGESFDKSKMPKGITVKAKARRTQQTESGEEEVKIRKPSAKKRKGATFGLTDEDHLQEEEK